MDELRTAGPFLISLGIGLMMGLERERRPGARVGLRTFAMVALLGTTTALLSQQFASPWPFIAGMILVGAIMLAAQRAPGGGDDPDTITTLAAELCFCIGGLLWLGHAQLGVALALAVTSLMYFKSELHGLSHKLSRQDLLSFLQFALITFIVLPLLPDRGYGPYGVLNPFRMWLMVVLISGLSLAGYGVLRIVGSSRGIALLGILGGAVSSTATTLVYARHVRQEQTPATLALAVILIANLMVLVRLAVLAGVMGRGLLPQLLPVLALGLITGSAVAWSAWRAVADRPPTAQLEVSNPAELRPALTFGVIFGVVLLTAAWLHDVAGTSGVYAVAVVSGLTDVDAITLSALQMYEHGSLQAAEVVRVVALAYSANLAFKAGIVATMAGRGLLMPVLRGFAATAAGLGLGLLLY